MKQNEFLRDKPNRQNAKNSILDVLNLVIPITLVVIGFWWSTQLFAKYMKYDPRIVGSPIFIFKKLHNYKLYSPFVYILCFFKYAFKPGFGKYFYASILPGGICSILAIIIALIISAIRSALQRSVNLYGTARWGTEKDLKKYGYLEKLGMVLGQLYKATVDVKLTGGNTVLSTVKPADLVCHNGKTNTLLLAPTRSGKGVSVIIPSLLNYPGSVIVFDPKGENWNITSGFRSKFSYVMKFSPLSRDTIRFNPLAEIELNDYAYSQANQIADILYTTEAKADSASEFFNATAKDFTTAVILHVRFCDKYKEKNLAQVLHCMSLVTDTTNKDEDAPDPVEALVQEMITTDHGSDELNTMIAAGANRLTKNEKERASVLSTAFSKLSLFEDPLLANATSSSDFKISDFIDSEKPISLYLTVPFAHIDRVSLVFRLIINFMLRKFSEGETQFGEIKLKNHLVFFLDEFPVLGAFPFIAKVMGILAGYGVTFLIVCQALNQIEDLYGQNHPFLDHCKSIVVYAPAKIEDAEKFTKSIGQESVVHDNLSSSGRKMSIALDNVSQGSQEVARNLLNADELLKLPANQCLILNQGMPPYIAKKISYYTDERFKDKANMPTLTTREQLLNEIQELPSNKGKDLLKQETQNVIEKARDKERATIANLLEDSPAPDASVMFNDIGEKLFGRFDDPPDPSLAKLKTRLIQEEREQSKNETESKEKIFGNGIEAYETDNQDAQQVF